MKYYGTFSLVGKIRAAHAQDHPIKEVKVASFKKLSGETDVPTPTCQSRNNPAYEIWRRDDLYHLAQKRGIENRANMSNAELVRALSRAQNSTSP